MKRYLIIGATSAIARACCRQWLSDGNTEDQNERPRFFLLGRSAEKLDETANDLRGRGAQAVNWKEVDLSDTLSHADALRNASAVLGGIDVALIAHGTLPDQLECQADPDLARREFSLNGTVTITLAAHLANSMVSHGAGVIAVITSVAGDRGRPSNYLYGSAKAAVSTFCEGLRARVYKYGVHVIDIRPGFVDTPMTKDLKLPRLLVATPEQVARSIVKGIRKRKDVLYVPGFWAVVLWMIRRIPSPIFKRLTM